MGATNPKDAEEGTIRKEVALNVQENSVHGSDSLENAKKRKLFREIGLQIGWLFQIVDDLIDYRGDSGIVGKPTKSDEKKGKATLGNL